MSTYCCYYYCSLFLLLLWLVVIVSITVILCSCYYYCYYLVFFFIMLLVFFIMIITCYIAYHIHINHIIYTHIYYSISTWCVFHPFADDFLNHSLLARPRVSKYPQPRSTPAALLICPSCGPGKAACKFPNTVMRGERDRKNLACSEWLRPFNWPVFLTLWATRHLVNLVMFFS